MRRPLLLGLNYGLKAYGEEQGIAALLSPLMGASIGVLFLRTAWKMSRE
jgi:hypothetical protein